MAIYRSSFKKVPIVDTSEFAVALAVGVDGRRGGEVGWTVVGGGVGGVVGGPRARWASDNQGLTWKMQSPPSAAVGGGSVPD